MRINSLEISTISITYHHKKSLARSEAFFNGGLFKSSYELVCLKIQLIDTIKLPVKKPILDEIFLNEKYVKEGLSSKEIATLTFSSRPVITKLLKEYNIPLKIVTRKNTGGHVYGYRKHRGKSINLKKEQEVIELIKSYRGSGYSYQKIADVLNDNKVQTKMA